MPVDLEQLLKDLLGDPVNKFSQFQSEQMKRLNAKLQEFARDAVKDELAKLHAEIAILRERVATLESERAESAADQV